MNEDIERILNTLKKYYDGLGWPYYPEDVLEPKDTKIIYDYITQLQNNRNKLKNILQNIEEIIKGSLRNVGFNEDYYEYMLSEGDIEKILDMIPDFEEMEGINEG